jgi:hypothetical protein
LWVRGADVGGEEVAALSVWSSGRRRDVLGMRPEEVAGDDLPLDLGGSLVNPRGADLQIEVLATSAS